MGGGSLAFARAVEVLRVLPLALSFCGELRSVGGGLRPRLPAAFGLWVSCFGIQGFESKFLGKNLGQGVVLVVVTALRSVGGGLRPQMPCAAFGLRVLGFGFRVQGFGSRLQVSGFGFRVQGASAGDCDRDCP